MSAKLGLHSCLHAEDVVGAFDRLKRQAPDGLKDCSSKGVSDQLMATSVGPLLSGLLSHTTQEVI